MDSRGSVSSDDKDGPSLGGWLFVAAPGLPASAAMSGVAGIYCLDGQPADPELLSRMTDRLAHWGPDRIGHWVHGPVAFGHCLLRNTPESAHEKLPATNDRGDLVITADARLDNRDELLSALGFDTAPNRPMTDSELILHAYDKWGEMCPRRLIGDFAFALWDARRQRLFCARDPLGIKPFHYSFDGKRLLWASEPWALLVHGAVPGEPNLHLVCLYLVARYDEPEETLLRGVLRLPPAHHLTLEAGRLRKLRYWELDPSAVIRYRTDADYAAHFLEVFREAVRARLRSHDRVGAWLSGGLDSSSIVCTARALLEQGVVPDPRLETFSMVFDGLPCDERRFIGDVARRTGVPANYLPWGGHCPAPEAEEADRHPDAGYARFFLWKGPALALARQKGIRVMLDGFGGDDLLAAGFHHLTDLARGGKVLALARQLRYDAAYSGARSPASLFFAYCLRPLVPRPLKTALRPLLRPFRGDAIPDWVDGAVLSRYGGLERLRPVAPRPRFPTHSQQGIVDLLYDGWNTNIALDVIGRFTARFGVELRYPFLDRRLVEFLLAIPDEQRWRGQWPKAVLRRAMKGILPESVRTRKGKADFTPALRLELVERQGRTVEDLIRTSRLAALGLVKADRLERMFEECRALGIRNGMLATRESALFKFAWLELAVSAAPGGSGEGG